MTQGLPTFHAALDDLTDLAEGLGLRPEAIAATGLPVQVVSTGVPQMIVPVWTLNDVMDLDVGRLNIGALNRACRALGTDCVHVFTLETENPESTVHVRMFAPLLGVPEDPATGSSNGAMGAYLVHYALTNSDLRRAISLDQRTTTIVSEQGAEMGRPSTLVEEVDRASADSDEIVAVRVGGQVVPVAEGVVRF